MEVEHDCDYRMWFMKVIDLQSSAMAFQEGFFFLMWDVLTVISLPRCVQVSNKSRGLAKTNNLSER